MKEMQETQSLGREDPLEKGMATHSSILTWRIPMDRGAWQATVHGVANSQTWLTMPTAAADRYMIERKIIDIDKLWASYAKDNCLFPHCLATVARILCCCRSAVERRVVFDYVRPHRQQPTRLPRPWDSPGKNTGVGRHCLLQCMKVKRESEVTQWCPTPRDPMDCGPPGSSAHGIFQARGLEWEPLPSPGILSLPSNPLIRARHVAALLGDDHPSGLRCLAASRAGLQQWSGHGGSGAHTFLSWPSPGQIISPDSSS